MSGLEAVVSSTRPACLHPNTWQPSPPPEALHLKGEILRPVVEGLPNLFSGKPAVSGRTLRYHMATAPKKVDLNSDSTYYMGRGCSILIHTTFNNSKGLEYASALIRFIYHEVWERSMMPFSGMPCGNPSDGLEGQLLDRLRGAVLRVRRAGRWFQVRPLTKAFIKACTAAGIDRVRSPTLVKAIVKTIRELMRIASVERRLVEAGVGEAWKLSELASRWGHRTAREWRNNKAYIIVQALTLQWVSKLFKNI